MAAIIAGVLFAILAVICLGLTVLNLYANALAQATGGDAGGVSWLFPAGFLACAALSGWLFFS